MLDGLGGHDEDGHGGGAGDEHGDEDRVGDEEAAALLQEGKGKLHLESNSVTVTVIHTDLNIYCICNFF